jgi:hypothetical protein
MRRSSKTLRILHAPHSQQIAVLDVSRLFSCVSDATPKRWSPRMPGLRPRIVVAMGILSGLLSFGLHRQPVIALRVVHSAILIRDRVEFPPFLGATNKTFEQATMSGQQTVARG